MRTKIRAVIMAVCLLGAPAAWALPDGFYDALVTPSSSYSTSLLLQESLGFQYWFETNALPGSYGPGKQFDILVLQTTGDWRFLGQVGSYYTSNAWQNAILNVPVDLRGQTREIRFSLTDYAPETDPKAYVRDVHSPVPEPGSLILLGTGLLGAAGAGLRKKRAV